MPDEEHKEPDFDEEDELDKLFKQLLGQDSEDAGGGEKEGAKEEEGEDEGPIDRDDVFITPDFLELPPKWFYEKVKYLNLPNKMGLTDRMRDILDKFYYDGYTKGDVMMRLKVSKTMVSQAVNKIRRLWDMYQSGALNLDEYAGGTKEPSSKGEKGSKGDYVHPAYILKTNTFREIDRTIASLLRPQVERSTQLQDVMARIGMITTYTLLQLGILEKPKFVQLAKEITENPEMLVQYVANQLAALVGVVDKETLVKFSRELLLLRQENQKLKFRIEELEEELDKYREWLYNANLLLNQMVKRLSARDRFEVTKWYVFYKALRGGLIAPEAEGKEGEGEISAGAGGEEA